MKQRLSLLRTAACAAALAAGPILTGCSGVVKNLNSAQVSTPSLNLSNPFGASNQPAALLIGPPPVVDPALVSAHVVLKSHVTAPNVSIFPFTQQSAGSLSSAAAGSASVSFNVNPTVTVDGATLPAKFTLSTVTISTEADDLNATGAVADSVVLPPLTSSAPVVFTQSRRRQQHVQRRRGSHSGDRHDQRHDSHSPVHHRHRRRPEQTGYFDADSHQPGPCLPEPSSTSPWGLPP